MPSPVVPRWRFLYRILVEAHQLARLISPNSTAVALVIGRSCGDEKNPRRHVRGEPLQQHGARVLQPVPPFRLPIPQLALLRRRQDRAHPLPRQVRGPVAAHHDEHAQHHAYRCAGARGAGHAVHRRGSVAALLRLGNRGLDSQEEVGVDHHDDLEKAAGSAVRPRDVVIVNTGWHKVYEDSEDYFCRAPGFVPSAGEWFVEKKVKVVGHDTQANDHPLATAIGPQRNGPLHPHLAEEYKAWSGGRDWKEDFPDWEPVHRILFKNGILGIENVGGDIDKVTGKRCTFALFPWNWERGDGCIIRLVAIVDPKGAYRIEKGEKF